MEEQVPPGRRVTCRGVWTVREGGRLESCIAGSMALSDFPKVLHPMRLMSGECRLRGSLAAPSMPKLE